MSDTNIEYFSGPTLTSQLPALAKACFAVAEAAYPTGSPWSEAAFLADQRMPQSGYVIASIDRQVVGFLGVVHVLDQLDITTVAVTPEHQDSGLTTTMFETLFEALKRPVSLFLEVRESNTPAIHLYQKLAFRQIGTRKRYYRDPEEDALLMKKTL